mmetsp:Transcript_22613/g.47909  ORF Transcript_22613/g.47909 Transcript_22613/m.47909 type:complete len:319 (+) Transcript_22613:1328-2284(+)
MIQYGRKACFMRDKKGFLPAHVACSRHCSPQKLEMLLKVNPAALFSKTDDGRTLLNLAQSTATKSHPNYALISDIERRIELASATSTFVATGQFEAEAGFVRSTDFWNQGTASFDSIAGSNMNIRGRIDHKSNSKYKHEGLRCDEENRVVIKQEDCEFRMGQFDAQAGLINRTDSYWDQGTSAGLGHNIDSTRAPIDDEMNFKSKRKVPIGEESMRAIKQENITEPATGQFDADTYLFQNTDYYRNQVVPSILGSSTSTSFESIARGSIDYVSKLGHKRKVSLVDEETPQVAIKQEDREPANLLLHFSRHMVSNVTSV